MYSTYIYMVLSLFQLYILYIQYNFGCGVAMLSETPENDNVKSYSGGGVVTYVRFSYLIL